MSRNCVRICAFASSDRLMVVISLRSVKAATSVTVPRTLAAAVALRSYKYEELGKLMFESHRSLKEDYEVMIQPM